MVERRRELLHIGLFPGKRILSLGKRSLGMRWKSQKCHYQEIPRKFSLQIHSLQNEAEGARKKIPKKSFKNLQINKKAVSKAKLI